MPRNSFKGGRPTRIDAGTFGGSDPIGFLRESNAPAAAGVSPGIENLTNMLAVRKRRNDEKLANPGGPVFVSSGNDAGWDAFFGGMQKQAETAADHGMRFGANFTNFGNGATMAPSLQALRRR